MTGKRFTNHITKTDADGTIHSDGILDANEYNKIIITNYFYIASLLNKLNDENEQLKQSVNNLKETILKITIAYQRKHDNTIVNLVDEVHEEDITDLINEVKE